MSKQIINQFSQFELTIEEQRAGQYFSVTQLQVLQNLLADVTLERVNLQYTPNNHQEWMQAEAELKGKINILTYLISCHHAVAEEVVQEAQARAVEQGTVAVASEAPPEVKRIFD